MASIILLLVFLGAAMACDIALPSVPLLAQLTTTNSPTFKLFNVPLFQDCLFERAKPTIADGQFIPSIAVGAKFSSNSFVDSTGNPLDQDSLKAFIEVLNLASGTGISNETDLFDAGLVTCFIRTRGGGTFRLGGNGLGQVEFEEQLAIDSYQCCLGCTAPAISRRFVKGPTDQCPTADQVRAAIDSYVNDVVQVNRVVDLNSPNEDADIFRTVVNSGLFFETDETFHLGVLSMLCNPEDGANGAIYSQTVKTVMSATQQVLGAIANIQQGVGTAQDNLRTINHARCCTILRGLDSIFSIAALTLGITDNVTGVTVPKPQTCNAAIQC